MSMNICIGVKFRNVGKMYYFSKDNNEVEIGDHVIVETIRGVEYGTVVKNYIEVDSSELKTALKGIIRKATEDDDKTHMENKEKEAEAMVKCNECIKKHNLAMKLLECEYTFDKTKILFYFFSDNRIDFRELVKDLASIFRVRIELRQVGVRDATKIIGGVGPCGRPFCCSTFLSEFKPVSVNMIKEQGISLNPNKISGCCGRLMCCLSNEQNVYDELNKTMPNVGDDVKTNDKLTGVVISVNILKQLVRVAVNLSNGEKEIKEYRAKDLIFKKRVKKNQDIEDDNEIRKLEEFEKSDVKAEL